MKKKHILQISNNQISHFHNSTFLNKLSRLSHQTILSRPSRPFFICVLIRLCRGPQLRECPVVSRVRKQSRGFVSAGVKWVYVGHTGLSHAWPLGKSQSSTRWQQGALQQRQASPSATTHTHTHTSISASEITLVQTTL